MRKLHSFFSLLSLFFILFTVQAQQANNHQQILASKDLIQISRYLTKLPQDHPLQKAVLSRLKQLRNGNWKSEPKLSVVSLAKSESLPTTISADPEKEEFIRLMQESGKVHDKKTVNLLNNIFWEDKEKPESVLLVRNSSSCNIILRLQGKTNFDLPVPAKGENFISLNKDSYVIKGKICNMDYAKTKDLSRDQVLTLSYNEIN